MRRVILALLLALPLSAQVPLPQVPVTGTLGPGGPFPLQNSGTLSLTSDANRTMVYPETSANFLLVTSTVSLTTTRNLIAPIAKGFTFTIENLTTGGQSIQIIGSSGTGIVIPNGKTVSVYCDGTNYVSTGGVSSFTASPSFWPSWLVPTVTCTNGACSLAVTASSIPNSALQNTITTINSTDCSLGGSCTIPGAGLGGTLSNANCTVGPGAGTGATCSVTGFDGNHHVTVTLGSSPAPSDTLYTLTFTASRGHTVYCTATSTNLRPSGTPYQGFYVDASSSATQYIMDAGEDIANYTAINVNVSCP